MKGGGRDFTKYRCRCKVGFDMQNGITFHPMVDRCHLMHFNDNKYRFQGNRQNHVHDQGDVTQPCPLAPLLKELDHVTNYTAYALSHLQSTPQIYHVYEKEVVVSKPGHKTAPGKGHPHPHKGQPNHQMQQMQNHLRQRFGPGIRVGGGQASDP